MVDEAAPTRSWIARAFGEVVPVAVGVVVASLALPFTGVVGAVVVFVLVGYGVSRLLLAVRRRPGLRRAYRLLLLAHVVFWCARGLGASVPDEPRPVATPSVRVQAAFAPFAVGVADAPFVLPPDTTLAGWGARPRRRAWPAFMGLGVVGRLSLEATGPPDDGASPRVPLFHRPERPGRPVGARALLVRAEGGATAFALVRLDLIGVDATLLEAVLGRVPALGLSPETLVLSATHTHTGPGGVLRAPLAEAIATDHFDTRVHAAVVDAVVAALESADRAARPAHVAVFRTRDEGEDGRPILTQNRTLDPDEVDRRVVGLRFDDAADGTPRAVVVNHAVLSLILRRRHMAFDPDLAGDVEAALSDRLPGRPPVLFLNGAAGDVSPRGTHGSGPDASRRLADDFAARIAPDVVDATASAGLRIRASRLRQDLGSPFTFVALGPRDVFLDRVLPSAVGDDPPGVLASLLALPLNALVWSVGLSEVRLGFTFDGAAGALVVLDDGVASRERSVGCVRLDLAAADARAAASTLAILWQPWLPTQAVGRDWRRVAEASGAGTPMLLSLAGGMAGYVTTPAEYDRHSYEARSSLTGREGAARIRELLQAAWAPLASD